MPNNETIVAIHQPQYLPYLGYFEKVMRADRFVLLDDTQFKKNEWQNRNRIGVNGAPSWLTVPVSFSFGDRIDQVGVADPRQWKKKHRRTIEVAYASAPHLDLGLSILDAIGEAPPNLARLNEAVLEKFLEILEVSTERIRASELEIPGRSSERLAAICEALGGTVYLSGDGGHDYLDPEPFAARGIRIAFQEFRHPTYDQHGLTEEFLPNLSAVDMLMHCGVEMAPLLNQAQSRS